MALPHFSSNTRKKCKLSKQFIRAADVVPEVLANYTLCNKSLITGGGLWSGISI